MGVVDDTSSVYTATTQDNASVDLSNLSLADYSQSTTTANGQRHSPTQNRAGVDEDFDAVLDDLKDESAVDLPPHACR